mmetsp:Transcript_25827/g.46763  ORF Transcript_25827/g.46763 Transcript_25827/m.46763 type:complete len:261 (+) Transcript_25827:1356-2138(+)
MLLTWTPFVGSSSSTPRSVASSSLKTSCFSDWSISPDTLSDSLSLWDRPASISTAHLITSSISSLTSRALSMCRNADPRPWVPVSSWMRNLRWANSAFRARRFPRNMMEPRSRLVHASHDRARTGSDGVCNTTGRHKDCNRNKCLWALCSGVCFSCFLAFSESAMAAVATATRLARSLRSFLLPRDRPLGALALSGSFTSLTSVSMVTFSSSSSKSIVSSSSSSSSSWTASFLDEEVPRLPCDVEDEERILLSHPLTAFF